MSGFKVSGYIPVSLGLNYFFHLRYDRKNYGIFRLSYFIATCQISTGQFPRPISQKSSNIN
jgi:hypothetical protein